MKILVPIDGSAACLRALAYVSSHSAEFAPELSLIHVHLPLPSSKAAAWIGREAVHAYYDEEANEALKPAIDLLAKSGHKAAVIKKVGDPGAEIASVAASGFDLIVMGNKGRTALGNMVMGSVATRTIAEATVPVLLVK
ncbi:MAG: universal stress protein [Betaproteobacteria bacterium]|nr:universal stress protein [Betaproteobacteria bacterium]